MEAIDNRTPDGVAETTWRALTRGFSMPARAPLDAAQATQLAGAVRFDVPHEDFSLACWAFGSGPCVVLAHGWNGRGAQFLPFVPHLVKRGMSVVLFDAPAHGDSGGSVATPVHAGRALQTVCSAIGPVHGLVGHSAGSAAGLWAFREGLDVAASVHLCGPSSFTPVVQGAASIAGLESAAVLHFARWVEALTGEPIAEMDLFSLRKGLRHPGLLFHAPEDKVVPFGSSELLHQAWSGSILVPRPGLGHRRLLDDPDTIRRTVDFLAQYVATP